MENLETLAPEVHWSPVGMCQRTDRYFSNVWLPMEATLLTRLKLSCGQDGATQGQDPKVQDGELIKNLIFLNI